jgi:hypothetical protein
MHPSTQPAKGYLAVERISNRRVARLGRFSEHYVSRVLNGHEPPSPRFRAFVAELLGRPEQELFRPRDRAAA